jgi:hypothetical protein
MMTNTEDHIAERMPTGAKIRLLDLCCYRQGRAYKIDGDSVLEKRGKAMGIDWMTNKEIVEAIPPVYTKYIGMQFFKNVK